MLADKNRADPELALAALYVLEIMTILAYLAAVLVYQVGPLFGFHKL